MRRFADPLRPNVEQSFEEMHEFGLNKFENNC